MKTYHFAMVPEKKGGLSTLLKLGLAVGGAYFAYQRLAGGKTSDGSGESPNAGTSEVNLGFDAAAREASDFAARVLKAAKRIPEAIKK